MENSSIPTHNTHFSEKTSLKKLSRKGFFLLSGLFILSFFVIYTLLAKLFIINEESPVAGYSISARDTDKTLDEKEIVIHQFPDTSSGIHVFNDQLATWEMSEDQFKFAATHYAGTQKIFASDTRRLRAYNPDFVLLNYRLGTGLGYQAVGENCAPDGNWIELIEGEKWVREFPENPLDEWFYKFNGKKVFSCEWGWYLMDISNPDWRQYWYKEVLRQIISNQADGVFVDSISPPNYFGGESFSPQLPDLNMEFEKEWANKIEDFLSFSQTGELEKYNIVVNVGEWITSRDKTDYSSSDGIFVEGFSRWADGEYFDFSEQDWHLQLNRILRLTNSKKNIILQQYIDPRNTNDRLFVLSNYLLIKGEHTFINMEYSSLPEWFPEYEIPIGKPIGDSPQSISSLYRSDWNVYVRKYSNGIVIVNPSNETRSIELFQEYYQALPFGGGIIPVDANISEWTIDYRQTSFVELGPNQGLILLEKIST